MKVIGICGFIDAGKDTAADYLVNYHNFKKMACAKPLKDVCAAVFGWDREILEGATPEARVKREELDPFWTERLKRPWSMRIALQQVGTEVFRNNVAQDIWSLSLEKHLRMNFDRHDQVISDIRFPEEINIVKSLGGKLWRIKRGPDPEWFPFARRALRTMIYAEAVAAMKIAYPNVHQSEFSWCGADFDVELDNNDKIQYLYKRIHEELES